MNFVVIQKLIQIVSSLIWLGWNGASICLSGLVVGDRSCVECPSFHLSQQAAPTSHRFHRFPHYSLRWVCLFSPVISLVESLPGEWLWICKCWFVDLPMSWWQRQALELENRNHYPHLFGVKRAHTHNYKGRQITFQKLTILFGSILCPCAFWANGNIMCDFWGEYRLVNITPYSTVQTQHFQVLTKRMLRRNIPPQRTIHKHKSKLSFYLPELTYMHLLGISLLKL